MHDSPSAQLIAEATKSATVHDADGRAIVLKKPGILAQFRIVEAAGPESAKNEVYMRMILPLIYVSELGGEPVTSPVNKIQLEGLMQRLGEAGVNAVMDGVFANFGQSDPEADKAKIKK